jgi:hypothetical protein
VSWTIKIAIQREEFYNPAIMRALEVSLFLLAGFLASAETSQELRSRYGKPDVERFTVRPGMSLTVEYGDDDQVCQAVIEPNQPIIHKAEPLRYMSPEVVAGVIDEVAPPGQRGLLVNTLLESMGCAEERVEEYANVWISRATDVCLPPARVNDFETGSHGI